MVVNPDPAFINRPSAQYTVWNIHKGKMDQEIVANGFDAYIGKHVDGVLITRQGLYNMLHLGGSVGTRKFLTGQANKADKNGTSMRDYAMLGLASDGTSVSGALGGWDNILTPEQKQGLTNYAVTQMSDYYNRIRTVEAAANDQLKLEQEQIYGGLLSGVVQGAITKGQIIEALDSGLITPAQFNTVLNAFDEYSKTQYNDENGAILERNVQEGLYRNPSEVLEAGIEMNVDPGQIISSMKSWRGQTDNNVLWDSEPVKWERDRIAAAVGNYTPGMFQLMPNPDLVPLMNGALTMFRERVLSTPAASPRELTQWANEAIDAFANKELRLPGRFGMLPQYTPQGFSIVDKATGRLKEATRADLFTDLKLYAGKLEKQWDDKNISEGDYYYYKDVYRQYGDYFRTLTENGTIGRGQIGIPSFSAEPAPKGAK